jgi:hypothetical protein
MAAGEATAANEAAHAGQIKIAELTSSSGALVLGLGLGVLLERWLAGWGVLLLFAGMVVHSWGMFHKRRLETSNDVLPRWSTVTYWMCWLLLALLLAAIGWSLG